MPADQRTYYHLIRMLVRAKRLGQAFELLKEMQGEGGGRTEEEEKGLVRKEEEEEEEVEEEKKKNGVGRRRIPLTPNVDSLGLVMEALGRRGEVKPALYLLEVMAEGNSPTRPPTYSFDLALLYQTTTYPTHPQTKTLDLKLTPKEWHVRPLRRSMRAKGLRHPLVPADPRAWLEEGLEMRKKKDMAGRRVKTLVESTMRAGQ